MIITTTFGHLDKMPKCAHGRIKGYCSQCETLFRNTSVQAIADLLTGAGYPVGTVSESAWEEDGEITLGDPYTHLHIQVGESYAFVVTAHGEDGEETYSWSQQCNTLEQLLNELKPKERPTNGE